MVAFPWNAQQTSAGRGRGDLPSQLCSWNPSERPTTVANTLELRVDAGQDPRVSGGFDATTVFSGILVFWGRGRDLSTTRPGLMF